MASQTRSTWPKGGGLLTVAAAVWLLSSPILGHMGPPLPCVVAGAMLGVCAFMLYFKPAQRRGWGTLAVITSASTIFLGSGAIIPALIGIAGGASAIVWKESQDGAEA